MKKPNKHHNPRLLFSIGQAVALAAGSASFAAISTALLASYWFSSTAIFLENGGGGGTSSAAAAGGTYISRTVIASSNHHHHHRRRRRSVPPSSDWKDSSTTSSAASDSLWWWKRPTLVNSEEDYSLLLGTQQRKEVEDEERDDYRINEDTGIKDDRHDDHDHDHDDHDDDDDDQDKSLKIAWLMSFPNSGTSYTLHLTREMSNCTTATNYALEGEIKDQPGIPVPLAHHHDDVVVVPSNDNNHNTNDDETKEESSSSSSSNGPWLQLIPHRTTNIPPRYILTKTHCGGFCSYCPPERYIETPRSFQIACQSGTKAYENEFGRDLKKKPVTYDPQTKLEVRRAIRLVRDPLDNIVARFHLDRRRQIRSSAGKIIKRQRQHLGRTTIFNATTITNNTTTTVTGGGGGAKTGTSSTWPELFSDDSVGFQQWCKFLDSNIRKDLLSLQDWIDDTLRLRLEDINLPCKAEFFRYVQWHNLASITVREMNLPTLTIHYTDYRDHFDETREKILQFLKLPRVVVNNNVNDNDNDEKSTTSSSSSMQLPLFESTGKEYSNYYTISQKKAIYRFLKEFASNSTWNELMRYQYNNNNNNNNKSHVTSSS